jgi:hypothetical protein
MKTMACCGAVSGRRASREQWLAEERREENSGWLWLRRGELSGGRRKRGGRQPTVGEMRRGERRAERRLAEGVRAPRPALASAQESDLENAKGPRRVERPQNV